MEKRLEGNWKEHGRECQKKPAVFGERLAEKSVTGCWERSGQKLFHGLFHGQGQNVSERSLTLFPVPSILSYTGSKRGPLKTRTGLPRSIW